MSLKDKCENKTRSAARAQVASAHGWEDRCGSSESVSYVYLGVAKRTMEEDNGASRSAPYSECT